MRTYAADIDGDEATDYVITYRANGNPKTRVATAAGIVSTVSWADQSTTPWVEEVRDLDGVPGDEVVVGNGLGASGVYYGLLSWDGTEMRDLGVSLAAGAALNHASGFELKDLDGDGRAEVSQRYVLRIDKGSSWVWTEQQWTFRERGLFLTGLREARTDRPKGSPLRRPAWLRPVPAQPAQSAESAFQQFLRAWAVGDQYALADFGGVDRETGVMAADAARRLRLSRESVNRLRARRPACADQAGAVVPTTVAVCTVAADGITVSAVVRAGGEEAGTSSLWLVTSVRARRT